MRYFITSVFCLFSSVCLSAQCIPQGEGPLRLTADDNGAASLVIAEDAGDDCIWVSWLEWADNNADIRIQLLDSSGSEMLRAGGVKVSGYPTASWTSGYDMVAMPDGSAVIIHSDSRHNSELNEFVPHLYRISRDGEHLWGEEGIALPISAPNCHRPLLVYAGDGCVLAGYEEVAMDYSRQSFTYVKVDGDGKFDRNKCHSADVKNCSFVRGDNGDIFLAGFDGPSLLLFALNGDGNMLWPEPLVIDDRKVSPYVPVKIEPDGHGGVYVPYSRSVKIGVIYPCLQRVSVEGERLWGDYGIDLMTEEVACAAPSLCVGSSAGDALVACWSVDKNSGDYSLNAVRIDLSGDMHRESMIELASKTGFGYITEKGVMLDDGSAILIYCDILSNSGSSLFVRRIGASGNTLWNTMLAENVLINRAAAVFDSSVCVFWTDNSLVGGNIPQGDLWGQRISLESGTPGVALLPAGTDDNGFDVEYDRGTLTVTARDAAGVVIYDASGCIVGSYDIPAGRTTLSPHLRAGLHIVVVVSESGETVVKKIMSGN